jgi:hypothetical protein
LIHTAGGTDESRCALAGNIQEKMHPSTKLSKIGASINNNNLRMLPHHAARKYEPIFGTLSRTPYLQLSQKLRFQNTLLRYLRVSTVLASKASLGAQGRKGEQSGSRLGDASPDTIPVIQVPEHAVHVAPPGDALGPDLQPEK